MALPPDELRKRIPQWSLESDGQLLQYMVQISKNLEQKCKETQANLNTLLLQLDETQLRFANASNGFNGVQQVKFVENRVKDDDESFYSVRCDEEIEEPGQRLPHAEIFQMAVEGSIANMYKCFEKVTVELGSDSDSEDDDEEAAVRNTVLRAVQKYPYIRRPLPYIIGSREWREKWHAGLIDSEEESETETKEQYSDSSEETDDGMFPSQANSNHTLSESEGSVWGVHADPRRRAPSMDPSVSGDDTMSVHSATSSAARRLPQMPPQQKVPVLPTAAASFRPPSLFPEQPPADDTFSVSSRTKVANLFEESEEEESTPTHQPVVQPPAAVSAFFKGNTQQQLQQARKTVNLFEDEPPPADDPELTPSTSNQSAKKPLNLFIDSDDDSFNNNRKEPPKPAKKLFDDAANNNPNDDDLFVPVKQSINGARNEGIRRLATNLFDDEPPVDDFDEIFKPKATTSTTTTVEKKIAGGKLVLPPIDNRSSAVTSPVKKVEKPLVKPIEPTPKKTVNLFDEDDDEKIFKPNAKETPSKSRVNLFEEESGDEVSPVAVPSKPMNRTSIRSEILKKKSIFDSDSNEDDEEDALFGGKSSGAKDPEPLPRKVGSVPLDPPALKVETAKLPDVNEEKKDSPMEVPSSSIPTGQISIRAEILKKKKSIFDSDSNEEDEEDALFGGTSSGAIDPEPLPRKVDTPAFNVEISKHLEINEDKFITSKVDPPALGVTKDSPVEVPSSSTSAGQTSIRAEILKKSIFDSDSNEEAEKDPLFGGTSSVEKAKNPEPLPEKVESVPGKIDPPVLEVVREKPKIPDEHPEDEAAWKDSVPSDDEYPHVANDIDYFLTTNTISSIEEKKLEEPLKAVTAEPVKEEPKSALNFSTIGLFDDVPPPDDNFDEPRQPPPSTDQGEDIFGSRPNSGKTSAGTVNRYLFMDDDGPPPDDRDEVDDRKEPVSSKISSIIDEMRQKSEVIQEDTREKPKINRLSAKVNINVNALLPGARRPAAPVVPPFDPEVPEDTAKPPPLEPEQGTGKLTQLNKGRAKIQTKRKPSSRHTRRANYENSFEQKSLEASEETRVVVGSEVKPLHVEVTAAHLQIVNQLLSSKPVAVQPPSTEPKKPAAPITPKIAQNSSKLFSDDESDDDLFGKLAKTAKSPPPKQVIVPPPAVTPSSTANNSIFDDSDDDDLFSKPPPKATTPSATTSTLTSTQLPSANKPKATTNIKASKSIFGSEEDSEGDDIFASTKKKAPPANKIAAAAEKKAPPTSSLFGDDDDEEEDDLFGARSKITSKPTTSQTSSTGRKPEKPVAAAATTPGPGDDPLADLLRS